jgi:hypothetical protein
MPRLVHAPARPWPAPVTVYGSCCIRDLSTASAGCPPVRRSPPVRHSAPRTARTIRASWIECAGLQTRAECPLPSWAVRKRARLASRSLANRVRGRAFTALMTLPRSTSVEGWFQRPLVHRPMVVAIPVLRRFKRRPIARSVTGAGCRRSCSCPWSRATSRRQISPPARPAARSAGRDIELGRIKAEPPDRDRRCHCYERIVERSPAMLLMLEALDRAAVLRAGRGLRIERPRPARVLRRNEARRQRLATPSDLPVQEPACPNRTQAPSRGDRSPALRT